MGEGRPKGATTTPVPGNPNGLTQMEREAVRAYTDPLLPTFGNKRGACRAAGYSVGSGVAYEVFGRDRVQAEIERIEEARVEHGRRLMELIDQYGEAYVRGLLEQMSFGKDLDPVDIESVFGDDFEDFGMDSKGHSTEGRRELHEGKAKAINAHNRNAIRAAKVRREAIEKLLAYAAGTPEQRIAVTNRRGAPEGVPLEAWDKEELELLEESLDEERRRRGIEEQSKKAIEAEVITEED